MVIVRLIGGLGNQMFQYAAGRAVAHRNNTALKLDVNDFKHYSNRSYQLHCFNIVECFANSDEVTHLKKRGLWGRMIRQAECFLPRHKRSIVTQRSDRFDRDILRLRGSVYLVGYWQSEEYFKDIEQIIRQEFTFRHPPDAENQRVASIIANTNSVSLHIRRGDYVSNQNTNRVHGVCSLEYYQNAIAKVAERVSAPRFFIFSDDIGWARDNLKLQYPALFVTNSNVAASEDLRLMSQCRHHIIANSSFSWWGAWLCTNPGKIVIAPQKWFAEPGRDTSDLIPESWCRI